MACVTITLICPALELCKTEVRTKSANQCIAHYIVIQAKALLHYRPDITIQQISLQLGFDDPTSFSRYFKTSVGVSPKEYRAQIYEPTVNDATTGK